MRTRTRTPVIASALVVAVAALFPATDLRANHVLGHNPVPGEDTNGNGLPDVCAGGAYTTELLSVEPAPSPGTFEGLHFFTYNLKAASDAARKKVSRLVLVFDRPLKPADVAFVLQTGQSGGALSDYGVEDSATKAGRGNTNNFVGAINPKIETALVVPFVIASTTSKRGLITLNVDTGTGGLITCQSGAVGTLTDEFPKGIEGPGFEVDPVAPTAVQTTHSLPECTVDVFRNQQGRIVRVVPGDGCVLLVDGRPISELEISGGRVIFAPEGAIIGSEASPGCYRFFSAGSYWCTCGAGATKC